MPPSELLTSAAYLPPCTVSAAEPSSEATVATAATMTDEALSAAAKGGEAPEMLDATELLIAVDVSRISPTVHGQCRRAIQRRCGHDNERSPGRGSGESMISHHRPS